MNDGRKRSKADAYTENTRAIINAVRAQNPEAEIMLVANMLSHEESSSHRG